MPRQIGGAGLSALGWTEGRDMVEWLRLVLGPGRPLADEERRRMEAVFGHSLEDVRVHDSRHAGEVARRLGAEAFTIGADVFGDAQGLSAETAEGLGLMAHELTHVVQQTQPAPLERSHGPSPQGAFPGSPAKEGQAQGPHFAPRTAPAISSVGVSEEAEAQASEQAVRRSAEETGQRDQPPAGVDVERLAERVYRLMREELALARQRPSPGAGMR
ncbi:MAG: DUF4157 domain-containing protein [Chloroflexota bacterium]|nr:DUF4157 domain-containing protein [Chloroflexota bacterium]